jgi:hypothetical protein
MFRTFFFRENISQIEVSFYRSGRKSQPGPGKHLIFEKRRQINNDADFFLLLYLLFVLCLVTSWVLYFLKVCISG